MNKYFLIFILLASISNFVANMILKKFVGTAKASFLEQFFNIPFITALCFWGLNLLFYTKAVQYSSVSIAYTVLVASTVILLILGSYLFLDDKISLTQIAGIAMVIFGIALIYK